MIPNRLVIGAIDSALAHVAITAENKKCAPKLVQALRDDYAALLEARKFIVANRKDV